MITNFRNAALVALLAVGFVVAATFGVLALNGSATASPTSANSVKASTQSDINDTYTTGCIIRFDPKYNGWPTIHENSAHINTGCESVTLNDDGTMRVYLKRTDPVVTQTATPDECLVDRDVNFGPSGGVGLVNYSVAKSGNVLDLGSGSDRSHVVGSSCNVWLGFTHVYR